MKFRSLKYYVREAIDGLLRNRLMALASIITVFSCIFIFAFSYCLAINIDYILGQLEASVEFSVFLKDSADSKDINQLYNKIKSMPQIEDVKYVSSEDALKIFSEDMDNVKDATAGLENDNPLPRSFDISIKDVKDQNIVVEELNKLRDLGIEKLKYDQEIIDIITTLNTGIRVVSLLIILVLIIISIVIIINTIKITVNSRKTEILIMKYVGATDEFIRWPFIIEGVLIGLVGSILPVIVCLFGYSSAITAINEQMQAFSSIVEFKSVSSIFTLLFPICLAMGIGIGVIGSVTSIHRHLHV